MALLLGLEKYDNFCLVEVSQGSNQDGFSVLICILFEFDDLLMQFLRGFLSEIENTLSGSALRRMGFLVVIWANLLISLSMVALNMTVCTS